MAGIESTQWVERLPRRWLRNGAIAGLLLSLLPLGRELWLVASSAQVGSIGILIAVLIGVLFVAAGIGLVSWIFGLIARRRFRRIVALDAVAAGAAVHNLPGRYAVFWAIGLALIALFGMVSVRDDELLVRIYWPGLISAALGGALAGSVVGFIVRDGFRKTFPQARSSERSGDLGRA